MIRIALIAVCAVMAGCAAVPKTDPETGTIPVVPSVHSARIVYVPVETTRDNLRECLSAKRAEAVKTSRWQHYAERLERLLGIEPKDDDK